MYRIIPLLILSILGCACAPSQDQMDATKTQVAWIIYTTQTAMPATATSTATVTMTPSPTITLTPTLTFTPTVTFTLTITHTVTNTPAPPTPTLNAQEVDRLLLCYKAAETIAADMAAFNKITGLSGKTTEQIVSGYFSNEKVAARVARFRAERRARSSALFVTYTNELGKKRESLGAGGEPFTAGECLSGRVIWALQMGDSALDSDRTVGVGAYSLVKSTFPEVASATRQLQVALETIYHVDRQKLEAVAAPIWAHVKAVYAVDR